MRCASHPDIETNLKCSKCDKSICPKCMVQTPVDARCQDCAQLRRLPTYNVSAGFYLRAAGTGLVMSVVCGVLWGAIGFFIFFLYLNLLLAPGFGYVIAEVIGFSVNRKRGPGLAVIAGIALVVSYLVSILVPWGLNFRLFDLLAVPLGILVTVTRLR